MTYYYSMLRIRLDRDRRNAFCVVMIMLLSSSGPHGKLASGRA